MTEATTTLTRAVTATLRIATFCFLWFSVGALVALIAASWSSMTPLSVAAHMVVVAFSIFAVLALVRLASHHIRRSAIREGVLLFLHCGFAALWVAYYATLLGYLVAFGEVPTLRLVSGYASQLGVVFSALPIGTPSLLLMLAIFILVPFALAFLGYRICSDLQGGSVVHPVVLWGVVATALVFLGGMGPRPAWSYVERLVELKEPVARFWQDKPLLPESYAWANDYGDLAADAAAALAYVPSIASERRNVIVIYVDALRADFTQSYGYSRENMPFVTSLVSSGRLKQSEWGLSACPSTICGLAAILQSRPAHLQSPRYFSLPLVLKRHGYKLNYILSSDHQSYYDLLGYYGGREIDFYRDGRDLNRSRATDDFLVLDGLNQLGPFRGEPVFLMLGLISPHSIAPRRPEFQRFQPSEIDLLKPLSSQSANLVNHYDNGVLQADAVIKLTIKELERLGYLQNAVVIITGDHGESFGEHGFFGHGKSLFNTELRVPVWILDQQDMAPSPRVLRQIDIAPTVLSRLGMPIPSTWHGIPGGPGEDEAWSVHVFPVDPGSAAVVRARKSTLEKYLVTSSGGEYFFDLVADPHERVNIFHLQRDTHLRPFRDRAAGLVSDMLQSKKALMPSP
jgi:glucan phosphoethanolaminetransferase (alkaline phosphatase superfamily)